MESPNLVDEPGLLIFPFARGTVASIQAVVLVMRWALDLPTPGGKGDGLGLRKLVWDAPIMNEPSIKLARRMGFEHEGTSRYKVVLREHQTGNHSGSPSLGWRAVGADVAPKRVEKVMLLGGGTREIIGWVR